MKECTVIIKRGREKPLLTGHPWIFSGAVKETIDYREPGDLCSILNEKEKFLARGYVNKNSNITVRVLSLLDEKIDCAFIDRILKNALSLRERALGGLCDNRTPVKNENVIDTSGLPDDAHHAETLNLPNAGRSLYTEHLPNTVSRKDILLLPDAFRLVNAEGDFFPGLIIDRYKSGFVIQALTAGAQRLKGMVVDGLASMFEPSFIYEKSSSYGSSIEGVEFPDGSLHGSAPPPVVIDENGMKFKVDIKEGQKTGFYLDQRCNRLALFPISHGRHVLNCFSYTGAFGVYALKAGALDVTNVDTSEKALEGARENARLNGFNETCFRVLNADVFDFLRKTGEVYDIIILDPPKFAGSKSELPGAVRGYKDINLNAMKHLKEGGFLMTFSCSGLVSEDLFQKIVFGATVDTGRRAQVIRKLHADADHPVSLAHREGEYLKGLLLRVI